ncbi:MAG: DivIVA domain-containing protein [Chitinispirillia bacterium]|nr:DivIVA domain-containing protein [Chitinispirillia bacterium]MCL2268540.1 DivIVA domain-containing protein [Chitinispirillia bacterium]
MRLTPLDIRKQPFPRRFLHGFDPDAVNSFLEHVAGEYQALIQQNDTYATQVKSLELQLEKFRQIEQVLNETLLTAQKTTDQARVNAHTEADLILKDAQIRADRYEDESRSRVNKLESELISLRNQRESFLARFKSTLKTQLDLLEVISGDLRSEDQPVQQQAQQPQKQQLFRPPAPTRSGFSPGGDDDTIDDVPPQPVIIG